MRWHIVITALADIVEITVTEVVIGADIEVVVRIHFITCVANGGVLPKIQIIVVMINNLTYEKPVNRILISGLTFAVLRLFKIGLRIV